MLNRILEGLSNLGERPAPYSETSVEIKNKILPNNSRTGSLRDFHINDMVVARREVSQFYTNHGSELERMNYQLNSIEPRFAPAVDEDDPFI